MTPEERDRLVRLEERTANLADDLKGLQASVEKMAHALTQLAEAFAKASTFGKGALWMVTKIAAVLLAAAAGIDFVQRHWPFRQ